MIAKRVSAQVVALFLTSILLGTTQYGFAMSDRQEPPAEQGASAQTSPGAQSSPEQEAGSETGGTTITDQSAPLPDSPGTVRPAQAPSSQTTTQKPVGTAAAEVSTASGVAASKPAGVAIAPAKQRRVSSLLIKVGAIVGAGIAVGTVYALSQASPSRPPGAR